MDDDEFGRRKAALLAMGGQPRHVSAAPALRLIGRRDEVHPVDVHACAYRTEALARAWHQLNLDHYGHPSLGVATVDGAVIGVLDLRPVLAGFRVAPVPPDYPDNYARGGRRSKVDGG